MVLFEHTTKDYYRLVKQMGDTTIIYYIPDVPENRTGARMYFYHEGDDRPMLLIRK